MSDGSDAPWYERWNLPAEFPVRIGLGYMAGFGLHWHELIEVVYVNTGSVRVIVEGAVHEAAARDIILINSGLIHGFERSAQSNETMVLQFGPELFGELLPDLRDSSRGISAFARRGVISPGNEIHRSVEAPLLAIQKEYLRKVDGYRLAISARLHDIATELLRAPESEESPPQPVRRRTRNDSLERVFAWVAENFTEPIRLDDAANVAALSRYYFSRYFREQTGQSFRSYVRRVRVSRAERLLIESELPIAAVADESGFASVKTFNRVFRSVTGCSPSEYRSTSIVLS